MVQSMTPLVSIITPTYNSEKYLQETLLCVQNQTYSNIEHIIVDGQSSDGTIEIVKKFPNVKLLSETEGGMYNAINRGIYHSNGQIISYLNSDDLYFQNTIELAVDYLIRWPEIELIYGDCTIINSRGHNLYTHKAPPFNLNLFLKRHSLPIIQPAAFWRKCLHDQHGYFNTEYKYSSDSEFFMRVCCGNKVKYTQSTMAKFRIHDQSISQQYILQMKIENSKIHKNYKLLCNSKDLIVYLDSFKLRMRNWPLLTKKKYWTSLYNKVKAHHMQH